jgi:hypothetical protein
VVGAEVEAFGQLREKEAALALDALVLRRVVLGDAARADALHAPTNSSLRSRKYSSGSMMWPAMAEAATT